MPPERLVCFVFLGMSLVRSCLTFGWNHVLRRRLTGHQYARQWGAQRRSIHLDQRHTSLSSLATQQQEGDEALYQELQRLSREIRRHDEIYYLQGTETELSDEAYDALVTREAALCRAHPHLLQRLEEESGLGKQTTRFGGRVGPLFDNSVGTEAKNASTRTAATLDRFQKREHLEKMYSLNNALSVEEVLTWLGRVRRTLLKELPQENDLSVEIFTEPKLDGLSLSLRYVRLPNESTWRFTWAATRGDGKQGQDVSVAVEQGLSVPQSFDWAFPDETCTIMEIRGEVVLPESVFATLPAESTAFSNARNAASGILLRSKQVEDDSESCMLRKSLQFYAYGVTTQNADESLPDGTDLRTQLQKWGFRVPQPTTTSTLSVDNETEWTESDIQPLLDYHAALESYKQGDKSKKNSQKSSQFKFDDYGMDGCVHKVASRRFREILGHTPRAPRWAVAHKFAAETVVTRLMAVDLQVGRHGALTPVAKLEPVELNGVLIQRATLHNFGHMQQALGSDRIPVGSSVLVRRAGEVIPQVVRRVDNTEPVNSTDIGMISLQMPDKCPACGSPVELDEVNRTGTAKNGTAGQVLRCVGPPLLCHPRAINGMAHAFSRDALDVSGISQARLEKLMGLGYLKTPVDLFLMAKDKEKLANLTEVDGWGDKSVQNMADKVNSVAKKGVSLARFIYSLGIRFVGLQSSEQIASIYGSVGEFIKAVVNVKKAKDPFFDTFVLLREENEATKGIGPSVLNALVGFSLKKELVDAAVALSQNILVHEQETIRGHTGQISDSKSPSGPLVGLKVVFTGTVSGLTRSKAKEIAKSMGAANIGNAVTKSTDLVVAGAKGGKKLQEAEKQGVRIISGEEFLEMVDGFTVDVTKE